MSAPISCMTGHYDEALDVLPQGLALYPRG